MSLDRDIQALSDVPLFSSMDRGALRLIAFAAETRRLRPGEVLFRKGEAGEAGFLLMSGSVALTRSERDGLGGHYAVEPGVLIGEQALLAPMRRSQTATILEASSLLTISRALFSRVLHEYPNNARAVRRLWAQRLHERLSKLQRLSSTVTGT